jgi:hypothetical protein
MMWMILRGLLTFSKLLYHRVVADFASKVHCKVVLASSCKSLAPSVNTVYKKFYILLDEHEKNQSH